MSPSQLVMCFIVAVALVAVYIAEPTTALFHPNRGCGSGSSSGNLLTQILNTVNPSKVLNTIQLLSPILRIASNLTHLGCGRR
ncbi:unnamed protein product [Larinioides sclopetarius]|uniref:Uncharacterized protein n=1 Tax=Larinioides sclopetarius TaxID=280406 RepID=A0AAV2BWB1_9ARAC